MDKNLKTRVTTGMVRFSYLHIWQAHTMDEGQEAKYSASIIIPKSDKKTLKEIKQAIENAKIQGKSSKFGGKIPANLKTPLRDGDEERPDDEAYKDSYFVNANCKLKPGIVDKDVKPILDQEEVYSGCYGRASITFYPFNTSGNKGIACGLNHIQKLKDGDPLGGRCTAEHDFDDGFECDDEYDDIL